jgi:hypothetical protein
VAVGDVPSAYIDCREAKHGVEAISTYFELMDGWIEAARGKRDLREVFPVQAPADKQHATMLAERPAVIRRDVLPQAELQVDEMVEAASKKPS